MGGSWAHLPAFYIHIWPFTVTSHLILFSLPHDVTSPDYHPPKVTVLAEKGEWGKSPFFLAYNPSKLQLLINGVRIYIQVSNKGQFSLDFPPPYCSLRINLQSEIPDV